MDDASRVRDAMRCGELRGPALRGLLDALPSTDRDAWLDRVLGIEELPDDGEDLPRGGVPYLPCAIDDILSIVDACRLDERSRVVDVGSGLGRVPILVHLLTGARTQGIEVQLGLVSRASAIACELSLDAVVFTHADARDADLEGDLFVLYAPFSGVILERTLGRLIDLSARHVIWIATIDLELPPPFVVIASARERVRVHRIARSAAV